MSDPKICRLCENEQQSSCVADSFCIECNDYFCKGCTKLHAKFPLLSGHCVIPYVAIATFPMELISQAVKCGVHPKQFREYYCTMHCEAFCFSCLIESHRCCDSSGLNKTSTGVRSSYRFTDVQKRIEEEFVSVKEAIRINMKTKQDLAQQKETIEVQLLAFTEKVNMNLIKLINQVNHLYKEQSAKLNMELQELRIHEKDLSNTQNYISQISKYCADNLVFLSVNEIEKLLKSQEEKLQYIKTKSNQTCLEVSGINTMNSVMQELEKMKVSLNVEPIKFETRSKRSLAQITLQPMMCKSDAKVPVLKLKCEINISDKGIKEPCVNDCTIFQDGHIVVLEQKHACILEFTQAGKLRRNVKIPSRPMCITAVGSDIFAFTEEDKDQVQIYAKQSMNSIATVPVRDKCNGISRLSENLFIVGCLSAGLVVISTNGERQRVYNTKELMHLKQNMLLTASKDGHIFCSLSGKNTIVAIDSKGILRFQFLNKSLLNPRGITLDANNNILVAGFDSNNIIWISNDGTRFEEILTNKHGIENPRGIDYNTDMGILVVCNNNGSKLSIYEI